MKLIADSGSTKTDWRLIAPNGVIQQVKTSGLNPYFTSDEAFCEAINEGPGAVFPIEAVTEVHFYGAGLESPSMQERYTKLFSEFCVNAAIYIEHDLLAAARAVCGNSEGITLILGTGANSCRYDGSKIIENISSMGYILGDEGSGADLGKRWLSAYLNDRAPKELSEKFRQKYGVDRELALKRVYQDATPNRFLASFAPFISAEIAHPYMAKLVENAFNEQFDHYVTRYENFKYYDLNVCGAVGYYLSKILRKVTEERGMRFGKFIKSPIAALTLYHLNES